MNLAKNAKLLLSFNYKPDSSDTAHICICIIDNSDNSACIKRTLFPRTGTYINAYIKDVIMKGYAAYV